jgi:beta-glucosidase
VAASFTVTNTGQRAGADVPQVYVSDAAGKRLRLIGFERVELAPGESKEVVTADPRLIARFDARSGHWRMAGGRVKVTLDKSATAPSASTSLQVRAFGK